MNGGVWVGYRGVFARWMGNKIEIELATQEILTYTPSRHTSEAKERYKGDQLQDVNEAVSSISRQVERGRIRLLAE